MFGIVLPRPAGVRLHGRLSSNVRPRRTTIVPIAAILTAVAACAIEALLASRIFGLARVWELLSERLVAPVLWGLVPLVVVVVVSLTVAISPRSNSSWAGPAIAVNSVGPLGFFVAGFQGHNAAGVMALAWVVQVALAVATVARLLRSPAAQ